MQRSARLIAIALVFSAGTALAQTAGTTPPPGSGQPGVDVYSTVYPRPPASNVTQPTTPLYPGQAIAPAPYQPLGIPAGNIIIYPSVTGGAFYDDNVFAHKDRKSTRLNSSHQIISYA